MRWSVLKASEQLLVTGRNAAVRCVLLVRVCCLLERCLYSWNLHCVCERACVVVPTPSFFCRRSCRYICLSASLYARVSQKPQVQTLRSFLCTLARRTVLFRQQCSTLCASGSWMPLLYSIPFITVLTMQPGAGGVPV